MSDRVIFPGFQANPYAVIARAGAYCLPSNAEGFPNALVEAMALGRPVVATDCPSGPAEILEVQLNGREIAAGIGGLLVECGNPDAMGRAMAQFAQPETRRDFGFAAQLRAGDFSVGRAVDAFWAEIEAT
jgi:N-acetylgalactosamine-N,N'-diacetylbacillosaminyl-diphospho-undecaprenol 4-alpha-N-acetylgalactosaminyltransferase